MSVLNKQLSMPSLPSLPGLRVRKPSRRAGSTAAVTGLEIGATRAIAAHARLQGGQIVAERVAGRQLPAGLMRDGVVIDPDRLAGELKSLFAEHKFSKRVRVGLATPRTVLRVIDLPPLDDKDIRTALVMQAQERIPMPLERAVMDFHKVGLVDTPEGQRLRVIVVVTEREGVDVLLDALRRAGLKPEGIDLSVFSVIRSLNHHVEQAEGPVLYAQLGDLVNIAIAEDGVCRFTRQAPQGLAMVLGRLAENRGVPLEDAYRLLHDGDDNASPGDGD
ncbi:MAG TPA: pilus assembly protein PilM, partial [Solirubrobacteraceae bacterium]|nr:pilus assembly protein PilM [Solirubrobacteraceae bacterium]